MAIIDPVAIAFSNQQVREKAEKIRNLYYELLSTLQDWDGGYNVMFPNDDSEDVEDNRQVNGVRQITGEDVYTLMVVAGNINTQIAGFLPVVEKICVRPLVTQG